LVAAGLARHARDVATASRRPDGRRREPPRSPRGGARR
jgi:hypothetical protein